MKNRNLPKGITIDEYGLDRGLLDQSARKARHALVGLVWRHGDNIQDWP